MYDNYSRVCVCWEMDGGLQTEEQEKPPKVKELKKQTTNCIMQEQPLDLLDYS